MMRAGGRNPKWNHDPNNGRMPMTRFQGGFSRRDYFGGNGVPGFLEPEIHGERRTHRAARLQARRFGGEGHWEGRGDDIGRVENQGFHGGLNESYGSFNSNPPYQGDDARRGGPTPRHPPNVQRHLGAPGLSPFYGPEGASRPAPLLQNPLNEYMSPRQEGSSELQSHQRPRGGKKGKNSKHHKKNRQAAVPAPVENEVDRATQEMMGVTLDSSESRQESEAPISAMTSTSKGSSVPQQYKFTLTLPMKQASQDEIQMGSLAAINLLDESKETEKGSSKSGENPTTSEVPTRGAFVCLDNEQFINIMNIQKNFNKIKALFEEFCEDESFTDFLQTPQHCEKFEEMKSLLGKEHK